MIPARPCDSLSKESLAETVAVVLEELGFL